jgi:hypothetical protein
MNKPTIYQELPPAVIEYKGIPKKRKKNPRCIFDRVEIMTAMLFIGLFSCFIIYSALFKK